MGRALLVGLGFYLVGATSYRLGKDRGYVEWRYVNL